MNTFTRTTEWHGGLQKQKGPLICKIISVTTFLNVVLDFFFVHILPRTPEILI